MEWLTKKFMSVIYGQGVIFLRKTSRKQKYYPRQYYRGHTAGRKNKKNKDSAVRRSVTWLIVIVLLAAAGLLIFQNLQTEREDNRLKVRTAGKMLAFTGLDEETLPELLERSEKDWFTYEDVEKVLEHLELDKTVQTDWTLEGEHGDAIPKSDFLFVYDQITALLDTEQEIQFQRLYLIGDHTSMNTLEKEEVYTEKGVYTYEDITLKPYLQSAVEVIVRDREILCVSEQVSAEVILQNVWISAAEKQEFEVFADGHYITFKGAADTDDVAEKLADIVLQDGQVTGIRTKEEQVNGKILSVTEEGVEIEEYGLIPFSEGFRIYKLYGELVQLGKEDLIPGYEQTEFIVADGKICGGLIVKTFSAENIRVLIRTNEYKAIGHEKVSMTPSVDYTILYGDKEEEKKGGEELTITADSDLWEDSRITVRPKELTGTIALNSVKRGYGTPAYRGFMEIVKSDEGLIVINEVSLEEYLYAVIPSEMPTSYGLEALKAQAVCARSYAYNQLESDTYAKYGAHVDDSTAFQVYQNFEEDELSIRAVDETNGLVMLHGGDIITAYYFSTSSGHTTTDAAWGSEKASGYLSGCFVGSEEADLDLTDEKDFKSYIKSTDYEAYEREEPWYRWRFTLTEAQLGNIVDNNLESVVKARPEAVAVKNSDGEYEVQSISSVGGVEGIKVNKRGDSGIIEELIVTGKDAEIKVTNEYAIRQLLGVGDKNIKKQDDSEAKGGTLLPSAYFCIEMKEEDDGVKYKFYGGGFGHGIGMSQNGARAMAEEGMDFKEILEFFYHEVEITALSD